MPQNKSLPVAPKPAAQGAGSAEQLILDWQTIWQSELQALAVDREIEDALEAAVRLSAALAAGGRAAFDRGAAIPTAGADAPPRAAAAVAAPDAHDAIRRLERRVAELERLLAQFHPGGR